MAKATVLADVLKLGMEQTPKIALLSLPKGAEKENTKSILDLTPEDNKNTLVGSVAKAFHSDLKDRNLLDLVKGSKLPYIRDLNAAVEELLKVITPQGSVVAAAQASQLPSLADSKAEQSATSTSATQGTKETSSTAETKPSSETSSTDASRTSSTGKRMSPNDKEQLADLANYVSKKSGIDAESASKIITQLAKDQKIVN